MNIGWQKNLVKSKRCEKLSFDVVPLYSVNLALNAGLQKNVNQKFKATNCIDAIIRVRVIDSSILFVKYMNNLT